MRYKNTNVMIRSPVCDTDFFEIVSGDLPGDTLVLYTFIIYLDYVLGTSKEAIKDNGFT